MIFVGTDLDYFRKEFTNNSTIPNRSLNYFKESIFSINPLTNSNILWKLFPEPSNKETVT